MSTIRVGNAPCSWGTLEFAGMAGERFSYAQMLDELQESGYTGTELGDWGFMPTESTELAAALAIRQLQITGAFVSVALEDADARAPGEETVVRTATLLAETAAHLQQSVKPFLVLAGNNGSDPRRVANAGRITPAMGLNDAQWATFAAGANRIAAKVQVETGLQTVFHHHCAGFVETPEEIDRLLALTDPQLLGLVFDTGHYAFGAGGCTTLLEALDRHVQRIWYVHFKDFAPALYEQGVAQGWDYFAAVRQGIFCELGKGCVDFGAVLTWLRARDYRGYITVEQDVLPGMGSPKASATRNRHYLTTLGL